MGAQAIANPFESQQPQPVADQSVANPFDTATAQAAPAAAAPVDGKIDSGQHGVHGWLQSVEDDIRYGSDNTLIGKALKKLGATGTSVGSQAAAGEDIASLPLGVTRAAKGTVGLATPNTDPNATIGQRASKAWQDTKDVVGGAAQAATIPGGFVAPEAGEVAGEAASGAVNKVGGALERVGLKNTAATKTALKAASDPSVIANAERPVADINQAVLPELHSGIHNALDTVGVNSANDINQTLAEVGGKISDGAAESLTKAAQSKTLSEKADHIGSAMRTSAQQIYAKLDEAGGGGQFQRFAKTIKDYEDALKNPALVGEQEISTKAGLEKAQQQFADFKQKMVESGLSDKIIKMADKLWSKGASMDEWSRKLLGAEDMSGALKAGAKPLNNAVRDLTAKASGRGHVLKNGMGDQADEIKAAVQKAADTIIADRGVKAQATKTVRAGARAQQASNKVRKTQGVVAGVLGGGAALKYGGAAKSLFTTEK